MKRKPQGPPRKKEATGPAKCPALLSENLRADAALRDAADPKIAPGVEGDVGGAQEASS